MFNPTPVVLANPNASATGTRMADYVTAIRTEGRRKNTALAFDPKEKEYREFCEHVYPNDVYTRYTITADKCYRFMFYTWFHDKKPTGRAKKKKKRRGEVDVVEEEASPTTKFDWKKYDERAKVFESNNCANFTFQRPTNPVGKDTFNTYKAVMKSIHQQQQRVRANNIAWEFIWDLNLKELQQHVKERAPAVKKATFVEKHREFAPYQIVEKYQDIAKEFWKDFARATSRRCQPWPLQCHPR
jgi:hypothetical protein